MRKHFTASPAEHPDPESSWNDRRMAYLMLAVAFLAAMAVVGKTGEPT